MAADSMKLIAYGKVLEDDAKSLKDYAIKEGDFLVVMIAKVNLERLTKRLLGQTSCKAQGRCTYE
jgi:hypothetical protein